MDFKEYQEKSRVTAKYPDAGSNFVYPALGLVGETGEVADKVKKYMRDDNVFVPQDVPKEKVKELEKELGDILWYMAQLCSEFGLSLEEVAQMNIDKLYSRMERGTLNGDGDNR